MKDRMFGYYICGLAYYIRLILKSSTLYTLLKKKKKSKKFATVVHSDLSPYVTLKPLQK